MIKKVIIAVISILLIAGLAAGGYIFYKTTTPEYALYQTMQDIRESGMDGLKAHLTSNAREKADRVTEWSDNAIVSGLLSLITQQEDISGLLQSGLSDMTWTLQGVTKEGQQATVTVDFDYQGKMTGSLNIMMLREDRQWKIDGVEVENVDLGNG